MPTLALTYTKYSVIGSIKVGGNCSADHYKTYYMGVAQVNSSVRSSQDTFFQSKIYVQSNSSAEPVCTLTSLNYTIEEPSSRIQTGTSYLELLNGSGSLLGTANISAAGTYRTAKFIWTIDNNITNTTNTTFFIRWRLKSLDSNRSVSIVKDGLKYTENVTYWGPDTVDLKNVTLVYKPSHWPNIETIFSVSYDGVVVTNYSQDKTLGLLYDPDLDHDTKHYFTVVYNIPETGHGATGEGRTPPISVIPTVTPEAVFFLTIGLGALVSLFVLLIYYIIKRR
ncbi:MAG: hypothetical protein ACTSWZ_07765 [Candidatus Heimdallarchaeaceae archaeon]